MKKTLDQYLQVSIKNTQRRIDLLGKNATQSKKQSLLGLQCRMFGLTTLVDLSHYFSEMPLLGHHERALELQLEYITDARSFVAAGNFAFIAATFLLTHHRANQS